jgi:hypothetical protein
MSFKLVAEALLFVKLATDVIYYYSHDPLQ